MAQAFLGALFTKIKFTFLKSVGKTDFYTPFAIFKEKSFHLLVYFLRT
jgi:hypothetical protein